GKSGIPPDRPGPGSRQSLPRASGSARAYRSRSPRSLPDWLTAPSHLQSTIGISSAIARPDGRAAAPKVSSIPMNGRTIARVLLLVVLIAGAIGLGVTAYDAG